MSKHNTGRAQRQAGRAVPIYVGVRKVGHVTGGTFYKSLSAARHFLQRPAAIAFDLQSLRDAEAAGAARVVITDTDTNKEYTLPISTVWARGFELDRGFGRQVAVCLADWNKDYQPAPLQLALV